MDNQNNQNRNNKLLKNTTAFSAKFLDNRLHVNGDFTFRYKAYDNMRKRTRVTYSEKENVFTTLGSYDDIQRGFATTLYTATNL